MVCPIKLVLYRRASFIFKVAIQSDERESMRIHELEIEPRLAGSKMNALPTKSLLFAVSSRWLGAKSYPPGKIYLWLRVVLPHYNDEMGIGTGQRVIPYPRFI